MSLQQILQRIQKKSTQGRIIWRKIGEKFDIDAAESENKKRIFAPPQVRSSIKVRHQFCSRISRHKSVV